MHTYEHIYTICAFICNAYDLKLNAYTHKLHAIHVCVCEHSSWAPLHVYVYAGAITPLSCGCEWRLQSTHTHTCSSIRVYAKINMCNLNSVCTNKNKIHTICTYFSRDLFNSLLQTSSLFLCSTLCMPLPPQVLHSYTCWIFRRIRKCVGSQTSTHRYPCTHTHTQRHTYIY